MRRTSLPVVVVLAALAGLAVPSVASANLTATVGSFGDYHTVTTTTPNLVTQPIGAVDCDTPIPITFSGLTSTSVVTTRYIQVWTAAVASANCGTPTARMGVTPACTMVTVDPSVTMYQTGVTSFPMMITARQLFGSCDSGQKSFFFFDVASTAADVSTTFASGSYYELDIAIDATAPEPRVLTGDAAGDATVSVSYTGANDLGLAPKITAYFDPGGCSGGDGGASSSLIPGTAPTGTGIEVTSNTSPAVISTASFGWGSDSSYSASGALAITVTDSAGNVSTLSNVVCVQHVPVMGFWDAYCASHGMTAEQCTHNYSGCSVSTPSRRIDLGALAGLALVFGAIAFRGARRRSR